MSHSMSGAEPGLEPGACSQATALPTALSPKPWAGGEGWVPGG